MKFVLFSEGVAPGKKGVDSGKDCGVVDIDNVEGFIKAAKTRQWDREKHVRLLA